MSEPQIEVDDALITWHPSESRVDAAGQASAVLWIDSVLAGLPRAMREHGGELYPRVAATWGRRSGLAVWPRLGELGVSRLDEAGLARLIAIHRACGWGAITIEARDDEARSVRMRVASSWEWRLKSALGETCPCAVLPEHWAALWSRCFGVECVAEEVRCQSRGADACEFHIYAASPAGSAVVDAPAPAAEMSLADARARADELISIINQLPDGVVVLGLDGRSIAMNPVASWMLGLDVPRVSVDEYEREGAVYLPDGTRLARDQFPIMRALRGETVTSQELHIRRPDGVEFSASVSAVPLRHADGTVWGGAVVLREISSEVQLRERLAAERIVAERHAEEYRELAAAAGELVGPLGSEDRLRRAAQRAQRIARADYAALVTLEPDNRTVWRAVAGNRTDAWESIAFAPGKGTAGRVIERNAPVRMTNFPDNPDFPAEEFPVHRAEGMRTAVGIPMRDRGRPFGAIVVAWRRHEPIEDQTVEVLQTYADIVAGMIVQARLFESVEQRAAELQMLNAELTRSHEQLQDQAAELEMSQTQLEEQATEMEMLNSELQERNAELDARVGELDAVLDQMADGVVIADVRGAFVRVNPAAERMHGRPLHGLRPAEWAAAFDLRDAGGAPLPVAELALTRALERCETVEGAEWTFRRADGTAMHLLGSASPLRDGEGKPVGAVLVMRDITDRARLVEELRRATSLKERFFAQMSHELRTPVNAILGYSTLIAEGIAGEVSPEAGRMTARIRSSAQHLLELVNDVLDISRLEAGKVSVDVAEFDLVSLLRDTLTSLEPQATRKGLSLVLDVPERLRLLSDPTRVRQIVLNLISNAVKFTAEGRVGVDVRCPDGATVAISVVDTGSGIPPEQLENIFLEFVQVGPRQEGTGLGLAISRRLARLLGGDIAVESEVGRGSRFTLTLPLAGPPPSVHA